MPLLPSVPAALPRSQRPAEASLSVLSATLTVLRAPAGDRRLVGGLVSSSTGVLLAGLHAHGSNTPITCLRISLLISY
jgi:hypothetical protein